MADQSELLRRGAAVSTELRRRITDRDYPLRAGNRAVEPHLRSLLQGFIEGDLPWFIVYRVHFLKLRTLQRGRAATIRVETTRATIPALNANWMNFLEGQMAFGFQGVHAHWDDVLEDLEDELTGFLPSVFPHLNVVGDTMDVQVSSIVYNLTHMARSASRSNHPQAEAMVGLAELVLNYLILGHDNDNVWYLVSR